MCASTAPSRPAWTCARPARCSVPSSAPWWSRTTCATAADTASRPARSGSSTGARRTGRRTSARCATTGWAPGWSPRAPRPARPSPSSSARWTSSASGPRSGWRTCRRPARRRPSSTWRTRPTGSAAAARSSCCWTSPRCTVCRRTRWSPPATCRKCGGTSRSPRPGWPPPRSPWAWPGESEGLNVRGHIVPVPVRRDGNGGRRRRRRGEEMMVPEAEFSSYYGRPVIKEPVWKAPDVAGYLFFGGLAGASSVLAVGAQLSGYSKLARVGKIGALGAISVSAAALVHDLGRPERFVNMLRVFKPSSPMSVGSWLLAGYGPMAGAAAVSEVTGILPRVGRAATLGAGLLGPGVATYTAALICDTAVPAWHEGYREMPYVFAGSAASAAGGLGLLAVHPADAEPARNLAVLGAAVELIAKRQLLDRLARPGEQSLAEPYQTGTTGAILRLAEFLTAGALVGAVLGRTSRAVSALSGAALVAASAMTRFGIFEAGLASARDPRYTIVAQRRRRGEE